MIVSAVVAMGKNGVIGKANKLLWHLPLEFKYFKNLTLGHHLIVGRKTFESMGRPLPGRTTILVSQSIQKPPAGVLLTSSIQSALALAKERGEDEVFVIGGAELYKTGFKYFDKLYVTVVDFDQEGDVYFPHFDLAQWQEEIVHHEPISPNNSLSWTARVFIRIEK